MIIPIALTLIEFLLALAVISMLYCWPKLTGRGLLLGGAISFALAQLTTLFFLVPLCFGFTPLVPNGLYYPLQSVFLLTSGILTAIGVYQLGIAIKFINSPTNEADVRQKQDDLVTLGIVGLFVWPIAIYVRIASAKALKNKSEDPTDEAAQRANKIAYTLGSIGSILMVSVFVAVLTLAVSFGLGIE